MVEVEIPISWVGDGPPLPLPQYMTKNAAGMDLPAAVEAVTVLEAGQWLIIPTGFSIAIPEGYEAQVRPRSGLAVRFGVTLLNAPGTIDADFRGEVCIILINLGNQPFEINRGDRIAQMIVSPVARGKWILKEQLDQTARQDGGFGHTGI